MSTTGLRFGPQFLEQRTRLLGQFRVIFSGDLHDLLQLVDREGDAVLPQVDQRPVESRRPKLRIQFDRTIVIL